MDIIMGHQQSECKEDGVSVNGEKVLLNSDCSSTENVSKNVEDKKNRVILHDNFGASGVFSNDEEESGNKALHPDSSSTGNDVVEAGISSDSLTSNNLISNLKKEKEEVDLFSNNNSSSSFFENKVEIVVSPSDNALTVDSFCNIKKEKEKIYTIDSSNNSLPNPEQITNETCRKGLSNKTTLIPELVSYKQQSDALGKIVPFSSSSEIDSCKISCSISRDLNESSEEQLLESKTNESTKICPNSELFQKKLCAKLCKKAQVALERLEICYSNKTFYVCKVCDRFWLKKIRLNVHMVSHTEERPFPCTKCNKSFKKKTYLQSHQVVHSDARTFQCPICNKKYKTKGNLREHMSVHSEVKPFVCKLCGKSFKKKIELTQHLKSHSDNRPFVCDICQKSCKNKGNLKHHMLSHSDEKPFLCEICGKTFKANHELNQHSTYHSNEKLLPETVNLKPKLDQQIVSHFEERIFFCLICEKASKTIRNLNIHMLTHCEKLFACETCKKSFKTKPELKQHMISHSDLRPFGCPLCEKSCKTKGNLKIHMFTHKGKKPFEIHVGSAGEPNEKG